MTEVHQTVVVEVPTATEAGQTEMMLLGWKVGSL